ncbi:hypothetical protein [Trichlorobacter lovleyi]|uniref:Uncharacterized protein n=1 Tax=Trichlorobacter lovleyi (strain ATCC BAA-1151 / DSM 17278 / SZ) TaxID=398767 RepID=B3E893_TRIL1|nr:hypothetical protein [Trichlorobacter lovleyi]ACD95130.1 hypothetical protein Glov_1409 [Trichlorobacter lovleyi SZ]
MALAPIVKLYRKANRPPISGGVFSSLLAIDTDVISLIKSIRELNSNLFDEILVDDAEITTTEALPDQGSQVELIFRLPTGTDCKFYPSLSGLITGAPKISRGEMPSEFYLIEEDYFNGTDTPFPKLEKLSVVCKLIKGLSDLAHYHDEKTAAGHYRLIFIQPEDSTQPASKTVEIDTTINVDMLDGRIPDLTLVESLRADNPKTDPHYSSKVGVFRVSLAEFLQKCPVGQPTFSFLVSEWEDFINIFNNNLDTYLSGFAFHKAKREVAEAELKIADEFSKIIIDITGKLLGIPISLAAAIAIMKSTSVLESLMIVIGLGLATLIFSGTVGNQQRQLQRIIHAKNIVFNALEGKQEVYPDELKSAISEMKTGLDKNENKLRWLLRLFRCLSWAPFLVGVVIFGVFYL